MAEDVALVVLASAMYFECCEEGSKVVNESCKLLWVAKVGCACGDVMDRLLSYCGSCMAAPRITVFASLVQLCRISSPEFSN